MKAADWQARSVRGFVSTAGKKHNITIESSKDEAGARVYRVAKWQSLTTPGNAAWKRAAFSS